jgi:hypothetical protein
MGRRIAEEIKNSDGTRRHVRVRVSASDTVQVAQRRSAWCAFKETSISFACMLWQPAAAAAAAAADD